MRAVFRGARSVERVRWASAVPIPGPPLQPIIGNLRNVDINGLMHSLPDARMRFYDEHGPLFKLDILGSKLVYVKDVDVAREVLKSPGVTNSDNFRKIMGYFFPKSVIVLEDEAWVRVRKILTRAFTKQQLDGFVPSLSRTCDRAVEHKLRPGASVDIHEVLAEVTFEAFHNYAYEIDFDLLSGGDRSVLDACIVISKTLGERQLKPIPWLWKLPFPWNRRADAASALVRANVEEIYSNRLRALELGEVASQGLLDQIILANSEEDARDQLSKDEILDQIGTFFFGAFDTTSNTLAMALNHLAHHPEVQDSLAMELKDIDLSQVTTASLAALPYLNAVIDETNRFSPTAQMFPRTVREDTEVAGGRYVIPKGATVLIDWSAANRDPVNWKGSIAEGLDEWRPERWLDGPKLKKMAMLPFGFGARMCIGTQIANLEMRMIIACLVQRLRFAPDPARPMEYGVALAFGPKDGAYMHVSPR